GARDRGDARGRAGVRHGERRGLHPPIRGRARDRGPGDDRPRARGAARGTRDGRDPDRRRRACVGDRARTPRRPAGAADRRRAGGRHAPRRPRLHDRRRDRRQAPGRVHDGNPRRRPRRDRLGRRRGDQRSDRAPARADEARRRGRGRGRRRGATRRQARRLRPGRGDPLRRQHRRDAPDPGHATRPRRRRALSRHPHAPPRPARRAREAARAAGLPAGQRRRGRAPARGRGRARGGDRRRADAADPRPGALRRVDRQARRVGLPGRAARLTRSFAELPSLVESLLAPHARLALVYFDAFGWRFLERHGDHPLLARASVEKWTSQFPSTTTAHTTTIHTGLPLARHGLYEWHVYEPKLNRIITPLWFCFAGDHERDTLLAAGLDAADVFPFPTLYERLAVPCHVAMPASFADSVPNTRLLAGAAVHGFGKAAEGLALLAAALAAEERAYGTVYLPEVDSFMHLHGPDAPEVPLLIEAT